MFCLGIEGIPADTITITLPRWPADVAEIEEEPDALCQRQLAAPDSNARDLFDCFNKACILTQFCD